MFFSYNPIVSLFIQPITLYLIHTTCFARGKNRGANENPTWTMAVIAFLLLIFFLVTTTIIQDKGILVRLPPISDVMVPVSSTNVFKILINSDNELLLNGHQIEVIDLREKLVYFISNPDKRLDLPKSPRQAVISIQNDWGTLYETYLSVYNEVMATYNQLSIAFSEQKFGMPYTKSSVELRSVVRETILMIISEAEPTDFADL